jgi:ribosome assembly protein YihI (activator of Der GTPase)
MHGHSKKQDPSIFCAYAQPLCVVRVKKKKKKKKNQKPKTKTNLMLLHVNHTFLIFEPSNWTPSL